MCRGLRGDLETVRGTPPPARQAALDALVAAFTDKLHRCYAKSIGTIRVSPNSAPVWTCSLTAKVRRGYALNRTNRAACRTGQVVPPSLVDEHKAIKRSIKSEIRRSNRCAHSTYIRSAASARVRASLIWKRSQRYSTGQTKTFGDRCTYKGTAYSGTPDVAATLTQKMRDTRPHVPGNPAYDQAFHDYIASTIPHLLNHDPTPHATMASLFTVGDFDKLLLRLSGRDTKSPGPDGVPYWMISRGGGALHAFLLDLYNLMWTCELIPTEW